MSNPDINKVMKELAQQIEAALGGKVSVQHMHVPEGSSLETELKKRADPNWCEECHEVHGDNEAQTVKSDSDDRQLKAIAALNREIARHEKWIDVAKKLRSSIATPMDKRTPLQTLDEMMLAAEMSNLERRA